MTAWLTVMVGAQTALKPGFPFNVYTVLYDACVTSISDYASEITGYTQYQPTHDLHTRAIQSQLARQAGCTTVQSHTDQCSHYVLRFRGRTLFFSRQKDFDFFCLRIQK